MNAIEVRQLTKEYHTGRERSGTLREMLNQTFTSAKQETCFRAIDDLSFNVEQGDRLGIIGKNGAGKSTLLKILSKITKPTYGQALLRGRVSSLLEVGTGFHPELTGRENIFLNGSILGMSRAEIKRKFDEIVEFSGIGKFLDSPVKHYSSGMYVRLAFSVAAHLEPEILIVDEVLAVGDAEFQEKCLGKMNAVAHSGRTILFVSHNMSAIERLCNKGLWLEQGRLKGFGPMAGIATDYLGAIATLRNAVALHERTDRQGSSLLRFNRFTANSDALLVSGKPCHFEVQVRGAGEELKCLISMGIHDQLGHRILTLSSKFANVVPGLRDGSIVRWNIPKLPLTPGNYRVNLFLAHRLESDILDWVTDAAEFRVTSSSFFETSDQIHFENDNVFTDQSLEVR